MCLKSYQKHNPIRVNKQTKLIHVTPQFKEYEFDLHIFKQRSAENTTKIVKANKQFSPFND
jgi:hypothetical protein